jgi:CubicO group peptidase (beta-lactamase class C family)
MNKLLKALLLSAVLLPSVFAGGEQAADRFVDYWNMSDGRGAQNEALFARSFIDRQGPDGLARLMNMIYGDNGEIAIHNITSNSDEKVGFVASSQNGNWMEITLELSADLKIAGLMVQIVPPPASDADKGLSDVEVVGRLENYMSKRVAAGEFSGSVLLARKGEVLFAQAYGFADKDKDLNNTLDTPINLGSMNKMFTGLAIAQLVSRGKLDYGDTVGKYLPDYPNKQVRDEVTLQQLLTHTSGIGSYWNNAYEQRKNSLGSVSDFAALFAQEPLVFEPGSDYQYSNGGPVVLGLIIEAVSGLDYYDYIREYVYAPAGMAHSGHYNKIETSSGKAIGYLNAEAGEDPVLISNFEDLGNIGSPAGGGYASANDLLGFATALYDGSLIDAGHREEMTTFKVEEAPGEGYAYLYADRRVNGRRYIGHNGGAPGINAEFSVFPDSAYVIVVLSNVDANATPVADQIRQWVGYGERM